MSATSSDLEGLLEDTGGTFLPALEPEVLTPTSIGSLTIEKALSRAYYLNILIYGENGVGKTRLAGSAAAVPDMCPVLCIDVEGGTYSMAAAGYDVDIVRVVNMQQFQEVYNQLYEGKLPYKTVILDSLTEIQKYSMYLIMRQLLQDPQTADRDPDIPSIREWGKNIEQTRKIVRAFRDLPVHTICTALVTAEKNQKTGLVEKRPQLSGKLSGEVAGFFDVVFYMYVKVIDGENRRLLLSTKTEDIIAKDRSARMPAVYGVEDSEPLLMSNVRSILTS